MPADLWLTGALATFFTAMLVEASGFRWEAAIAPVLAALAGLTLCGLQAWHCIRDRAAPARATFDRRDLAAIASFGSALVAVVTLGFAAGGAAYTFGYTRWSLGFSSRGALLAAALVALFAWGVIGGILGARPFGGLLMQLVR